MIKIVEKVLLRDAGGSSLEYGIIAGLISTAVVTTIFALGVSVGDLYQAISLNLTSAFADPAAAPEPAPVAPPPALT